MNGRLGRLVLEFSTGSALSTEPLNVLVNPWPTYRQQILPTVSSSASQNVQNTLNAALDLADWQKLPMLICRIDSLAQWIMNLPLSCSPGALLHTGLAIIPSDST